MNDEDVKTITEKNRGTEEVAIDMDHLGVGVQFRHQQLLAGVPFVDNLNQYNNLHSTSVAVIDKSNIVVHTNCIVAVFGSVSLYTICNVPEIDIGCILCIRTA